ncbi:DNA internalization-related competence protein ComEC/Rec2 [Candidatus Termititenax persephonae]|uniref:DNA internalization-related competence protein ComEC/Rec2 n=1 Tax=Candidatus Termititenax persephonae TaxID=2218525 RepID=A0A388TIX8_9BACT|nr:DNA internalization-related competence protein ComEC/Rec2 [Candidatus Termititenax persephonae]
MLRTAQHQHALSAKLAEAEAWRPEQINLRIVSDIKRQDTAASFTAKSSDFTIMATLKNAGELRYGDELTLRRYRLEPLRLRRNFFITSYDDYLYSRGYVLHLQAAYEDITERLPHNSLFGVAMACKNRLAQVQRTTLPEKPAEIMCALLFGSASSAVDSGTLTEYRRAGIIHLLVVSGMHIAIFLTLLQRLISLWRLRAWPTFWLITFINVLFVFAVGAGASVLRAGLMAEIALLARTTQRQSSSGNALAMSGLVLAFFNPLIIFDVGFQLSLAATFSLIFFVPILEERLRFLPGFWRGLLAGSIAPLLLTMPLGIYYFHGVSLGALFLNMLILPWSGLLVNLGFVSSLLGLVSLPLAMLVNAVNYVLLALLDWLVGIFALTYVDLPQIPLGCLLLSLALPLVWALWPKYFPRYALGVCLVLLGFFLFPWSNTLRIIFLDIGQGDGILLWRGRQALVIDCGSESGALAGEILHMTLLKLGVRRPSVLLTHAHADHYNGLLALPQIDRLVLPERTPEWLAEKLRGKARTLAEDLPFVRLYRPGRYDAHNENNNSQLALLEQNGFRLLFTGDAEAEAERFFLDVLPEIDVLKAGHHGSKTSSSAEFLDRLKPDNVVISAGRRNKYRHPSPEALARLQIWGKIWRTDTDSAIMVTVYPRHYKMTRSRDGRTERFVIRKKYF